MSTNIITVSSVARPVKAALFYRAGDLKKVTKILPRRESYKLAESITYGRLLQGKRSATASEIGFRLVGLDWREYVGQ
jgi:hypothetical protein